MEAKYRVWDKDRKEYLSAGMVFIGILPKSRPVKSEIYLDIIQDPDRYKERFIIEQCAGLKDKNGIDIFEGAKSDKALETTINKYQKDVDRLTGRMVELTKQYRTWELPKEYRDVATEMQDKRNVLNKALNERARRRRNSALKEKKPENKTFVNSFGEATHREITTASYKRAQKRIERDVLRNLGR